MASAAKALQLGLRRCCASATTTTTTTTMTMTTAMPTTGYTSTLAAARGAAPVAARAQFAAAIRIRCISSTARRSAKEDNEESEVKEDNGIERAAEAGMGAEDSETAYLTATNLSPKQLEELLPRVESDLDFFDKDSKSKDVTRAFWNKKEPDPDMIARDPLEDEMEDNDMTSMAHSKLEEIRERRHYARVSAWEMPLLAKLAKPFEPPTANMPLRFRYTSYMGEFHPAEKKVVVEFCPADLDLTPVQQDKLKKLAGARYNPGKEIVRISCESYEHQAQNKRYLGDLVAKLIAEAKDPKDTFEDIPLDTRHYKSKVKPKFPKEWRMTEERRKELQAIRAQSFLIDQKKTEQGALVDGTQRIRQTLAGPEDSGSVDDRVAELVRASPARGQTHLRQ